MARILIVDDMAETRGMLADLLSRGGHVVDTARNGVEAVERFREYPADLLICDVMMPMQGGLETMNELRQKNPILKIIAISGMFDVTTQPKAGETREWATKMGADYTLSKPIDTAVIENAVNKLLG